MQHASPIFPPSFSICMALLLFSKHLLLITICESFCSNSAKDVSNSTLILQLPTQPQTKSRDLARHTVCLCLRIWSMDTGFSYSLTMHLRRTLMTSVPEGEEPEAK